ncbi:protein phosphatase [Perkinsela sp. CCAP 1560/4]|nr:protein phosphatase [Perkinsela sp. CCAP 1560/4]|eukprot:KNH06486.1 protein phosphatase [Perkinsela sp. CCAP 1560/4]
MPCPASQETLPLADKTSRSLFKDDIEREDLAHLLNRDIPTDAGGRNSFGRKRKLHPIERVDGTDAEKSVLKTPQRPTSISRLANADVVNVFHTPLCVTAKYRATRLSSKHKHSRLLENLNRELRKEFLATIIDTGDAGTSLHGEQVKPVRITTVGSSAESSQGLRESIAETSNFRQIAGDIFVSSQLVVQDGKYRDILSEHSITDIINVASHCRPEFTDITSRGSKRRRVSCEYPPSSTEKVSEPLDALDPQMEKSSGDAHLPKAIKYHRIECVDEEDYPILQLDYDFFADLVDEILAASSESKVLVHCVAGMNRSACLCVAYLVDRHGLDIRHAIRRVRGSDEVFATGHIHRIVSARKKGAKSDENPSSQQFSVGTEILSNEGFRHELIQFCVNRCPDALAPLCEDQ